MIKKTTIVYEKLKKKMVKCSITFNIFIESNYLVAGFKYFPIKNKEKYLKNNLPNYLSSFQYSHKSKGYMSCVL